MTLGKDKGRRDVKGKGRHASKVDTSNGKDLKRRLDVLREGPRYEHEEAHVLPYLTRVKKKGHTGDSTLNGKAERERSANDK